MLALPGFVNTHNHVAMTVFLVMPTTCSSHGLAGKENLAG